ncbi:MAG: hypothetical protein NVSMB16_04830 [Acidimicrobiales bacterium]
MHECSVCECPAPPIRAHCAFCGGPIVRPSAVSFALTRRGTGFGWFTQQTLVAAASQTDGMWVLTDARDDHVLTLVPVSDGTGGHALVGSEACLLGSIRLHEEADAQADRPVQVDRRSGRPEACVALDPDGDTVLVLRSDGGSVAHLVDHRGDMVALASWEDDEATTDLLVTPLGTRHSLAMVFGLLLALEISRQMRRAA